MNDPAAGTRADPLADASRAEARPLLLAYSRDFWIVFAASFALNTTGNLFVLFPVFVTALGGSAATIGAIVGTGSLAALMARPAIGPGIDRFGRRQVALVFLALDGAMIMAYTAVHSTGLSMYAVRSMHGAIEGTARVALFAFVYEILPSERQGEAMSMFSLCGMVPAAFAPMAGEELIKRWGFGGFFVAAGVLCMLAGVAIMKVSDDRPPSDPAGTRIADGPGYAELLTNRGLLPLWVATLLFAIGISSRLSFVAPFAYQEGISRVGWYFALYSITAIALRLLGSRAMDRVGLERMLAPSFAVLGVGLAMLALTGRYGMLNAAAVLGGIGHGYVYPLLSALVIGRTQSNAAGRSSSIYSSLYDFGAMAGPYILGAIASGAGYPLMFVVSGAFAFAAAAYLAAAEPRALNRRLG